MVDKCVFYSNYLFSAIKMRILCGTFLNVANVEVLPVSMLQLPRNENLMRNILKASHASLKKDWYGGEKPG